jgi:hypothetical protein
MARGRRPQLTAPPEETIPKVLSECQRTSAVHRRSVGLLLQVGSSVMVHVERAIRFLYLNLAYSVHFVKA